MSAPLRDLAALVAEADASLVRMGAVLNGHAGPPTITAADLAAQRFLCGSARRRRRASGRRDGAGGAPKKGKSWLLLGLGIAIAAGGQALGKIPVEGGDVLLLCLEDNQRRLQERLWRVLDGELAPAGFTSSPSGRGSMRARMPCSMPG